MLRKLTLNNQAYRGAKYAIFTTNGPWVHVAGFYDCLDDAALSQCGDGAKIENGEIYWREF